MSNFIDTNFKEVLVAEYDFEYINNLKKFFNNNTIDYSFYFHYVKNGVDVIDFLYNSTSYSNLHCIFLNLNIPFINEAIEGINNNFVLRQIPIVIFTSKRKDFILKYYNFEKNCYIVKPMDFRKCLNIIDKSNNFITNNDIFSLNTDISKKSYKFN